MTVLVIATVSGFSTWSIQREKQRFQQGLETQAATILNTMVAASKDAFYTKNFDGIENLLEKLTDELEDEKILTSGRAYQAQGRLISDAFVSDVSIYSLEPDPFGKYLIEHPDVITFREGEDLIAGRPVTLVGQTLGAVSIGLSKESLNQKIAETRKQGLMIAIVAGAIGTILSHFLSRSITHPLDRLTAAIEKMASGQISQKLMVKSCDEIAVLAQSFNQMSDRLTASMQALEERADALQRSETEASEKALKLEQALEDLHQAQGKLVHNEKMAGLGQLVAGIAHEINNPVSFIAGNVEYAQNYTASLLDLMETYRTEHPPSSALERQMQEVDLDFIMDDLPRLLTSMNIGAKRITEIVCSLRTFSRLDESDSKRVNIHEGLESTLMILNHRLKAQPNRSEIRINKAYGDLPHINCYPGPLNQVFMNLFVNAIDALDEYWTQQQGETEDETSNVQQAWCPLLWIETHTLGANSIQISIQDNGPGIPEAIQQKIFDPFFTTKKIGHGTGLGLSISYQIIVDQHKGTFICKSQPGEGTTFIMTIPI